MKFRFFSRNHLAILIAIVISLATIPTVAQTTVIGGYDMNQVADATVDLIAARGLTTQAEATELRQSLAVGKPSSDPLVSGVSIIALYDRIGAILVTKNIATAQEIDAVKKTAAASGGVVIGGVNPVVLAASYLNLFAQKGIITLHQAQLLLDSSRK